MEALVANYLKPVHRAWLEWLTHADRLATAAGTEKMLLWLLGRSGRSVPARW